METKKIIFYAIIAYIFYKLFIKKEGFALSTGIITLDDIRAGRATLDPNLQYFRGIRNTTSTTTPAINGGQGCTEYPDVVFKPVPATDAVCKTWTNATLEDSMYNFETTSQPGSFHQKIISLPTTKWRAFQIREAGGFVAMRLFQGRMQCLSGNGKDCYWRGTLSDAESDAINANSTPAPSILSVPGPQNLNIPADTETNDYATAFRALRDSMNLTNAQLSV